MQEGNRINSLNISTMFYSDLYLILEESRFVCNYVGINRIYSSLDSKKIIVVSNNSKDEVSMGILKSVENILKMNST
jgi:hypothetical protein